MTGGVAADGKDTEKRKKGEKREEVMETEKREKKREEKIERRKRGEKREEKREAGRALLSNAHQLTEMKCTVP